MEDGALIRRIVSYENENGICNIAGSHQDVPLVSKNALQVRYPHSTDKGEWSLKVKSIAEEFPESCYSSTPVIQTDFSYIKTE